MSGAPVICMEMRGLQGRAKVANGKYAQATGETQHRRPVYVQQTRRGTGMYGDRRHSFVSDLDQSPARHLHASLRGMTERQPAGCMIVVQEGVNWWYTGH